MRWGSKWEKGKGQLGIWAYTEDNLHKTLPFEERSLSFLKAPPSLREAAAA